MTDAQRHKIRIRKQLLLCPTPHYRWTAQCGCSKAFYERTWRDALRQALDHLLYVNRSHT